MKKSSTMENEDIEDKQLYHEFHTNQLLENLAEEFDGPVYRSEADLEAVRNSDSPTVAVVAPDEPMIFYVPREKFLSGEIGMNSWDLFEHAGML